MVKLEWLFLVTMGIFGQEVTTGHMLRKELHRRGQDFLCGLAEHLPEAEAAGCGQLVTGH